MTAQATAEMALTSFETWNASMQSELRRTLGDPAMPGVPLEATDWARYDAWFFTANPGLADLEWLGDIRRQRVLEIGPGFGALSVALARAGAEVIALDSNPERAAMVNARFDAALAPGRCDCHDPVDLVYLGDTFDAVITLRPDLMDNRAVRALGEYRRVLKRGGRLVVALAPADMPASRRALGKLSISPPEPFHPIRDLIDDTATDDLLLFQAVTHPSRPDLKP